jgi:hypothetical protein
MPSLDVLEDKRRLQSLKVMLHQYSVPAAQALIERHDKRRRPLLRVWPSLSRKARSRRRLPRPL